MKFLTNFLSIVLIAGSAFRLDAQTEPTPTFTFSVLSTEVTCGSPDKVCYTIAVTSDLNGEYYLNDVTFRYYVDPTIFEAPVVGDHTTLPQNGFPGVPSYGFTIQGTETPTIGSELGFGSDASYWVKGTISPSAPENAFLGPRSTVSTTPLEIMQICLTSVADLELETSEENLCYPFIFDSNHKTSPDDGFIQEGIQTNYTEVANVANDVPGTVFAAFDGLSTHYLWGPNVDWDGSSTNAGYQSIGQKSTTGCIENLCKPIILPVEIMSFNAEKSGNEVDLTWSTASEIKNDFFDIQHSVNGLDWTSLGTVHGNGTTQEVSNYSFSHTYPSIGTNYYRLEQVDYDGSSAYSDVRMVRFENDAPELVVNYYPNPTSDILHITTNKIVQGYKYYIYDFSGKLLMQKDFQQKTTMSLDGLEGGIYLARLVDKGNRVISTQKIIKL